VARRPSYPAAQMAEAGFPELESRPPEMGQAPPTRRSPRRVIEEWPRLEASLLMRVQFIRIVIGRLRKEHVAWADALAWLLQASVAHVGADDAGALDSLARAADALDAVDMTMHAIAARAQLATLRGGGEGVALSERVASWFARHEVKSPARMIAMLTQAFDALV
jgi:hypothetical protein